MAEEQTGIVLGKLAEPYPDGLVSFPCGQLIPATEVNEIAIIRMRHWDRYHTPISPHPTMIHWRDDPDYFAAERKRKRRRV